MNVAGTWYNELNSTMVLEVNGKTLKGKYVSAVGEASGPYDLIGFLDVRDETPTVGWTVVWNNDNKQAPAVTTWCGQAQLVEGDEQIDATWLLSRSTKANDDWESTMIGKDVFRRVMASEQEVRRAKIVRGIQH